MKIFATLLLANVLAFAMAITTEEIVLEPNQRELLVDEGNMQILSCSINTSSSNNNDFTWEAPSNKGIDKGATTTEGSGSIVERSSILKIKSFSEENVGTYKCKIIIPGPSPRTMISSIQLQILREVKTTANFTYKDPSATLSCNLDQNSHMIESVTWLKDDEPVAELDTGDTKFTVYPENNTLVISNPIRENTGIYVARFVLKDVDSPYDCRVEYTGAPLILDFEKSENVVEGGDLLLECKVKGFPYMTVTWLKDDLPLNASRAKLSTLDMFGDAHLVIDDLKDEDAGVYKCEVHSDLFNSTSRKSIIVRVKDKLAPLWPALGILAEVIVLSIIIYISQKNEKKEKENKPDTTQSAPSNTQNEGLRHRTNNPTA